MGAFDDLTEAPPQYNWGALTDDTPEEKAKSPSLVDYAKQALGVGGVADTARMLAYPLESAGIDYGRRMRESGDWLEQELTASMTPGGRRAATTPMFEGSGLSDLRPTDKWGQSLFMGAARSVPQMAMLAPVGAPIAGAVAKAIPKAATAATGLTGLLARNAPAGIGFGTAEGLQAGTQNASQTRTQVENTPLPELSAKSPRFRALLQDHDPETARQILAKEAADYVFPRTALSTGAIGALTGGGAFGELYKGGGVVKGLLKGGLEEAAQETLQSGGEQGIQNLAERNFIDPAKNPWDQVVSQALTGGAIGGVTGGAFGGAAHIGGRGGEEDTSESLRKMRDLATKMREETARQTAERTAKEVQARAKAVGAATKEKTDDAAIVNAQAVAAGPEAPAAEAVAQAAAPQAGVLTETVDAAAHEAASSPENDRPEPTTGQIAANNAKLGHPTLDDMDVSIENPAGSIREDKKNDPPLWRVEMNDAHYGYIRGTQGFDKDHLDVFIKKGTPKDWTGTYFVVNQLKDDGTFDEHKPMAGFSSEAEARAAYLRNYDDAVKAEKRISSVVPMPSQQFKAWAFDKTEKGPKGGSLKIGTIVPKLSTIVAKRRTATPIGESEVQLPKEGIPVPKLGTEERAAEIPADTHEMLRVLAANIGHLERGGKAMRAPSDFQAGGDVVGVTRWVGQPEWAKGLGATVREAQVAVEKAIAGKPLGAKQKDIVQAMLTEVAATRANLAGELEEAGATPTDAAAAAAEIEQATPPDPWPTMTEEEKNAYLDARFSPSKAAGESQGDRQEAPAGEVRPAEAAEREPGQDDEEVAPRKEQAANTYAQVQTVSHTVGTSAQVPTERSKEVGSRQSSGTKNEDLAKPDASRPSLDLQGETEAEIQRKTAERAKVAEAERAKANAPTPGEFTLTGSERAADVGAAAGQQELAPVREEPEKPKDVEQKEPSANPIAAAADALIQAATAMKAAVEGQPAAPAGERPVADSATTDADSAAAELWKVPRDEIMREDNGVRAKAHEDAVALALLRGDSVSDEALPYQWRDFEHDGFVKRARERGPLPAALRGAELDIQLSTASGAFSGTSHDPDRRGRNAVEEYVATLKADYESLQVKADTDEGRVTLDNMFNEYREGYRSRYLAWLGAHSRVMSAMITGPAKFPTESNRKRSNSADRRHDELRAFRTKALGRIRDEIAPTEARSISSDDPQAVAKLREKLAAVEALQAKMRAINEAHRRFLKNPESLDAADIADAEKQRVRTYKPAYSWEPHPIAPYQLQNNNAEIKRLKERIAQLEQRVGEETFRQQFEGFEVVDNAEANRLQIIFPGKPDAAVREKLKANGFKWAPTEGAWQRFRGQAAEIGLERALGVKLERTAGEPPVQASRAARQGEEIQGLTAPQVRAKLIEEFGAGIDTLIRDKTLHIVEQTSELPERLKSVAQSQDEGWYDPKANDGAGAVYLNAPALRPERVVPVLLHELGEHFNLPAMLGKDGYAALQREVNALHARGTSPVLEDAWRHVSENYDYADGSTQFLSEIIARVGETANGRALPWYKRLLNAVRAWLLERGFKRDTVKDLKDEDLRILVEASARQAIRKAGTAAAVRELIRGSRTANETEESARAKGFTLKAYRGVQRGQELNETGTVWATTNRDVAEAYAREVWGYDDPEVITVMVKPDGIPQRDIRKLTPEQAESLGAFGDDSSPQAIGIYHNSDDSPLGSNYPHTAIHVPASNVVVVGMPLFSRGPSNVAHTQLRSTPWPADGDHVVSTSVLTTELKAHKDYTAAKSGDVQAAARLVQDLFRPAKIREIRQRIGADAYFVPVISKEATGHNKIPLALAEWIAAALNTNTVDDVVQVNQPHHTGAKAMERLIARPVFDGKIEAGRKYALVDDVTTMGSTLSAMADHIAKQGGKVAGAVVLVNASRSATMLPSKGRVRDIERRYGDEVRELFGIEPAALNSAEATYILGFRDAQSLRDRATAAGDETRQRYAARGIPQEGEGGVKASRGGAPAWVEAQSADTQEALRKAGVYFVPPSLRERVSGWRDDWQKRVRQGLFDQFDPIKQYDYKAYMLARMTRASDAALEAILNYGTVRIDGDGAVDVDFESGGFLGILKKLHGEHDRFLAWVIGNRAERLLAEGREHNFTPQDVERLKDLNRGAMHDGTARPQLYASIRMELDRYNKAVLDVAENAGLIDADGRATWEKDFYVPFYRLMEEEGVKGPVPTKGLVNQYAFKVLKGGEQVLGDPLENVLRNWSHLLDASLKNQAARASLLAAERVGAVIEADEATARQIAKATANKRGAVSFVDTGALRWFVVEDAFLLDALKSIGFTGFSGPAMKTMQKFKRWLTLGVTVSPTFRIRNLIRDSLSMIGANPASYNVLGNVLTGWKATKEGTPEYASIIAGGGVMRFGTLLEGDRAEHVKRLIESGVPRDTILDSPNHVKAMLQKAWDWWQHVGDRAENVNRVALYKKLRSEGKTHLEASYAARDIMDFSMQGTWAAIRFLTQTVPFMNARLQGLYKLGRGAKEDPRRFGIVLGGTALASLALLLAYQDDDDWKAREDWDRETFWWFKIGDTAFRIPKPFEIGAIATLAERGYEAMATDQLTGREFADRVGSILMEQLSLNPVPQLAKPMIEVWANRDFFTDRPIETMGMERLSKDLRAHAGTSATAQLIGNNGLISPVQIDHLARGYFGWLGAHIVATADLALRPAMGLPAKPEWRVDEVLVLGDFARSMPAYQSKYVTKLYDQISEVQEAMADLRHLQQIGAMEEAREYLKENRDKIRLYRLYGHAERQLQKVNKQIKLVQQRAGTPEEKRERLDALYGMRNRVARLTVERARALEQRQ